MTFLHIANEIRQAPDFTGSEIEIVAPGFYTMQQDIKGIFITPTKPLTVSHKVYGNTPKIVPHILDTFMARRNKVTSALFSGLKGSGKTLLTRLICQKFVEDYDGVVIVLNEPFADTNFQQFMATFNQPVIVVIDEFEKTYADKGARNAMLSVLDGVMITHALFLMTSNETLDKYNKNLEFFFNRPGRVYFNLNFESVDIPAIREYCEDNLIQKDRLQEVLDFVDKFREFNMDMLAMLVNELNHHPEYTVLQISTYMNVKPDITASQLDYKISQASYMDVDVTRMMRHVSSYSWGDFFDDDETVNIMCSGPLKDPDDIAKLEKSPLYHCVERPDELVHYISYDQYWCKNRVEIERISPDQYKLSCDGFTVVLDVIRPKYRKRSRILDLV